MKQKGLPGMPKRRTTIKFPEVSDAQKAVEHFEFVRGRQIYGRKALLKQAKDMLEAGYDVDTIKGCIDWLNDEYPDHYTFSFAHVAKRLPDYVRVNESETVHLKTTEMPEGWKR